MQRTLIREAFVAALEAYAPLTNYPGGAVKIATPGDWPTNPTSQTSGATPPEIKVKGYKETKNSLGPVNPIFHATCYIRVDIRLTSRATPPTDVDAQNEIELMANLVEQCIIPNYAIGLLIEQFTSIDSTYDIVAEGAPHTAQAVLLFGCAYTEGQETYDTTYAAAPLEGMDVYVDPTNVDDPNGTYTPPFDYTPTPAPRTQGPDGRVEGALKIDLPQP